LGRLDDDLDDWGREQARLLADHLSVHGKPDFIAVSPMKRAIGTALYLNDRVDATLHPVRGFVACDVGDWEGQPLQQILQRDRSRYESWLSDPDFPAPGGESIREVFARAYSDLLDIVHHGRDDETLLFILPEAVLRCVCCAALDLPLEAAQRFTMEHAAYAVFERIYPGGPYQMKRWNDTRHLIHHEEMPEYEEELLGE
jgi:probable phosphoglycerate mutase